MEEIIEYDPLTFLSSLPIGGLQIGQNLKTRDGKLGNCLVIGKEIVDEWECCYELLTDFGNTISMFHDDLDMNFLMDSTTVFVVDVKQRLEKQIELLKYQLKIVSEGG